MTNIKANWNKVILEFRIKRVQKLLQSFNEVP